MRASQAYGLYKRYAHYNILAEKKQSGNSGRNKIIEEISCEIRLKSNRNQTQIKPKSLKSNRNQTQIEPESDSNQTEIRFKSNRNQT